MEAEPSNPLEEIAGYYSGTLARHGETPQGVDWNGEESQRLRFEQLTKVIREDEGFSLHDLGCGYGALHDYLATRFRNFSYHGHDISSDMIQAASRRLAGRPRVTFSLGGRPSEPADYAVASGIFGVKLRCGNDEWLRHIESTLDVLHAVGHRGFAFNCLTIYSDPERMRDHLYYADPALIFDRCKRRYSRHVALLHDYGLYEFTVIVRR